ncbi:DUF3828 domain-containing protein [Kaistia adipata]|uniref:DUF3828 domain-containing protein n=1 Tax=Kaistia adipata TaxID=166954 RepID=UPI0004090086|nr:DUF3828 domain-containing protein [Kaistia adipata]
MSLTRRGVAHLLLAATLGVGLASTHTGSSVASDDPQAFVAAIYDTYADGGLGLPLDAAETVQRLFEPRLAAMILDDHAQAAELGDAPKLGADPFVDAQDWDLAEIRVAVEAVTPDRAEGHVAFANFGEPKRVDLELVRGEDGDWRIRDILWQEGSLRGLYTH